MAESIGVKGYVPKDLRRRAFSKFVLHDMTFSGWLQAQLERWLREVEASQGTPEPQSISKYGVDDGEQGS